MTDQTINASLLTDAAGVVGQAVDAMLEMAKKNILSNPLEYYRWQRAVEDGKMFAAQLTVLSERVAEQEQASAGEQTFGVFRDGDNSIDISGDSPQLAVGDTVRVDSVNSGDCVDIEENELIGQTATVTIENSIFPDTPIRVSLNNKEYGPGAWVKASNLTLIRKANA